MAIELKGQCPLLQVFDMPASLAFYRDKLGFEIVQSAASGNDGGPDDFGWVWLRLGGADVMLNAAYDPDAERPASPEAARVAAHDDTGIFFSCSNVDAAYEHVRSEGLEADPPTNAPYGMRQLYLKGPDGFSLCFQRPIEL